MKTGFTKEAGYGLVGSAMRDGRRLIMVIAGLKSINERKQEAQKLLDWGFRPVQVRSMSMPRATGWAGPGLGWHVALGRSGRARTMCASRCRQRSRRWSK